MNKNYIILGGVILGIYFVDKFARLTTINQGTPYENTGVVGTLGNVTNIASGGVLSNIGSAIGGFFADIRDRVTGVNEIVTGR